MAKKVKVENGKYKVFAFMINPHEFIIVSQDGKKLAQVGVELGEAEAKEKLVNPAFDETVKIALGITEFSTVWIDDPAGEPEVIRACELMEKAQTEAGNEDAEEEQQPITLNAVIDKCSCEVWVDGKWQAIALTCIALGDTFRIFDENRAPVFGPSDTEFTCTEKAAPDTDAEGEVNYHIACKQNSVTVANIPTEQPEKEPQFQPVGKTKIIDVEVPETHSEHQIKEMVRKLQQLKQEMTANAAAFREEIKEQERALFAACNGKSFKPMECAIEEDWDSGERRYIRPDNGEVAHTENIPYEERQLNMNKDLDDATPGSVEDEVVRDAAVETDDQESGTEIQEPETEESTSESEAAETETVDFPECEQVET